MGLINKPHNFEEGTLILPDQVNENFDEIYQEFNGGIDDNNLTTFTVDDSSPPSSNTGKLSQLLGALANRIKTLAGVADWKQQPKVSMTDIEQGNRFQISGNNKGLESVEILRILQFVPVVVPAGKQLVLKNARYSLSGGSGNSLILEVSIDPALVPIKYLWQSLNSDGEETPNHDFGQATSLDVLVYIRIAARNSGLDPVDLSPAAGWWLDFAIEDAPE